MRGHLVSILIFASGFSLAHLKNINAWLEDFLFRVVRWNHLIVN